MSRGYQDGTCPIHGKTWFTSYGGCNICYEHFMPRQDPLENRALYMSDFGDVSFHEGRSSIGRVTHREMKRLLAHEFSYAPGGRVTKPEPHPEGQRPYEGHVLVDEALGTRQM